MLYIEGVAYHNLRRILIRLVLQTIRTPEIRNIAFRRHPGSAKKDDPVAVIYHFL